MDFAISLSLKQSFFDKMKKERCRSQAKIDRAFGWTKGEWENELKLMQIFLKSIWNVSSFYVTQHHSGY